MQQFISAHADAAKPVKSYALDLSKTDTIASWVQKCVEILLIDIESWRERPRVTAENPDIDSVIINAGLQRLMDLTKPAAIDWPVFHEETTVNYVSHVMLGMAFLEFFQKQHTPSSMIL
jgi:short-subunit dehydrogenase involved in D-alanine esterification of teichoic acids